MWKFLGQGPNLSHSSNLSCRSGNARSLTHWVTSAACAALKSKKKKKKKRKKKKKKKRKKKKRNKIQKDYTKSINSDNFWVVGIQYIFLALGGALRVFYLAFFVVAFLGMNLWHMEVPRLGAESELPLPATATAMPDSSLRPTSQLMATLDL